MLACVYFHRSPSSSRAGAFRVRSLCRSDGELVEVIKRVVDGMDTTLRSGRDYKRERSSPPSRLVCLFFGPVRDTGSRRKVNVIGEKNAEGIRARVDERRGGGAVVSLEDYGRRTEGWHT